MGEYDVTWAQVSKLPFSLKRERIISKITAFLMACFCCMGLLTAYADMPVYVLLLGLSLASLACAELIRRAK